MIRQKLIDKFKNDAVHMSCIYLGNSEEDLRYFLEKHKPKNVIEIGTYQGVSAAIISEYADEVYTVDVEVKALLADILQYLEIKNVYFIPVENRKDEIKEIKDIFKMKKIDFVFLDGEHFNGELKKDYEMTKECSKILIHDYSPAFKEVYDFCNNLKGYTMEVRGTFCMLVKEASNDKPRRKTRRRQNANRV